MKDINALLDQPLKREYVRERQQAGRWLSYIEGHHCIREANRIFGFDGWSMSLVSLDFYPDGMNEKGNVVISAAAVVTITAIGVTRTDVGHGSGFAKAIADARESAGKEAVTDGMKRAFRTFGDQFGNALYDKEQEHVMDGEIRDVLSLIQSAKSHAELKAVWQSLSNNEKSQYEAEKNIRKEELDG